MLPLLQQKFTVDPSNYTTVNFKKTKLMKNKIEAMLQSMAVSFFAHSSLFS